MRRRLFYRSLLVSGLAVVWGVAFAQEKPAAPPKPDAPAKTEKKEEPKPAAPNLEEVKKQAGELMRAGKFSEAAKTFKQAITLNAKDIQSYVGLGQAQIQLRRYEEAAQAFQMATELNPIGEFFFFQGAALLESEQYPQARMALARAAELEKGEPRSYLAYADSYLRAKDYPAARTAYLRAMGFAPDNPNVHFSLGKIAQAEGKYAEALEYSETALRCDAKHYPALVGRLLALEGLKRKSEADKGLSDLIAKTPKEAAADLAEALESAGKHTEAIPIYKMALEARPQEAVLWGNLGWSQYGAKQYEAAIQSSREALKRDPSQAYVRFNLGLLYAVQDKWEEAKKEYEQAIAIAVPTDLRAGLNDVKDALKQTPNVGALKQAQDLLKTASRPRS